MHHPTYPTTFLVVSFLISSTNAQMFYYQRRFSIGRIIAGCVVGLFAIFLCFLMMMLRRRRQRQRMVAVTTQAGVPPNIQLGNKPMFGGPWGSAATPSNRVPMSAYDNQVQNYNPYNNAAQYPSYPSQSPLPPPPVYAQGANNHGYYTAPSGHPPHAQGQSGDRPYSMSLDPLPPAHTTSQDDSFVGGFRK